MHKVIVLDHKCSIAISAESQTGLSIGRERPAQLARRNPMHCRLHGQTFQSDPHPEDVLERSAITVSDEHTPSRRHPHQTDQFQPHNGIPHRRDADVPSLRNFSD